MLKNSDETVRFKYKRRVNTKDKKLRGTVDGWSSAPHLANHWPCHSTQEIGDQGLIVAS